MTRFADALPAGALVQGSMLRLPLRSACLGGAWANASLLHFSPPELRIALREIHRVLAPSGVLHLTLKRGEGTECESSRYGALRWFQYWSGAEIEAELAGPVGTSVWRDRAGVASCRGRRGADLARAADPGHPFPRGLQTRSHVTCDASCDA